MTGQELIDQGVDWPGSSAGLTVPSRFPSARNSSTASRDFTPVYDASVVLPVLLRATNEDTGQQILTASDLLAGGISTIHGDRFAVF